MKTLRKKAVLKINGKTIKLELVDANSDSTNKSLPYILVSVKRKGRYNIVNDEIQYIGEDLHRKFYELMMNCRGDYTKAKVMFRDIVNSI